MKAKDCSLFSMILGACIILVGHIFMWIGKLPNATSNNICACGFSVMGCFGAINISMIIDKFTNRGE